MTLRSGWSKAAPMSAGLGGLEAVLQILGLLAAVGQVARVHRGGGAFSAHRLVADRKDDHEGAFTPTGTCRLDVPAL